MVICKVSDILYNEAKKICILENTCFWRQDLMIYSPVWPQTFRQPQITLNSSLSLCLYLMR